jgi:adenylate cyclase
VLSPVRKLLPRRWRWLPPVAALIAAFHFLLGGAPLDWAFFDFSSRHPLLSSPVPEGSALVLIDEAAMHELGREPYAMRWPFPRMAFAGLIAALDRAGAARIVFDFTFFEQAEAAEQDSILAGLAAAVPSVVLARTARQAPVFWDQAFVAAHPALFQKPRTGDVTFQADADDVARTYRVPESLAALAFDPPANVRGGLLRWHGGLADLREGNRVPVLSATRFLVRGIEIIKRVSDAAPDAEVDSLGRALAAEASLTGDPSFDAVRGRTVFVGASASGTYDVKAMPVGKIEPAVLIHWTAWANLREGGFITPLPRWVALVGALAVAVLIGLIGRWQPGLVAPGLAAGGLALAVLAGAYAALGAGWFLPPATPAAAALFALLGVTAENFLLERQRKREVQAMFGSYVDPGVVAQLVRDPAAIRLGGERRQLTVLFSDLAGFTDLAEKMPEEQLLAVVNLYLQEVSDCLLASGAYIDKYIGDAVMAVYGAPLSLPDHAAAACEGALAAQRVLAGLNPRFERDHGCTLHMRIGINTGEMIVGNLGSERKKNYTVLGDAVNLASRLESANKEFGTAILLGETTAGRVQGRFATRPLTRLRVKGKHEAVEVHELVGAPGELTPGQQAFLAAYAEGYAAACARRFADATAAFGRAVAARPDDAPARAWQEQSALYAANPPPTDWQPLLELDSK